MLETAGSVTWMVILHILALAGWVFYLALGFMVLSPPRGIKTQLIAMNRGRVSVRGYVQHCMLLRSVAGGGKKD